MTFSRPGAGTAEVWTADANDYNGSRFGANILFALSCTVNGQTRWDNNFGRNYSVSLLRNMR